MDDFLRLLLSELGQLIRLIVTTAPRLVLVIAVVVLGLVVARFARRAVRWVLRDSPADPLAKSVLADGVYVATLFLVTILSLAVVGVDVGALIAGLGLTTLAVGFALRDILENLAAGVLLLLSQPYKVGDIIRVGPEEGAITDMTVRATIIRTAQGTQVVIPNRTIFAGIVENKTAYPSRRLQIELPAPAGFDLRQVSAGLARATSQVPGVLSEPPPEVDAIVAADGSIRLCVFYWVDPHSSINRIQTAAAMTVRAALDAIKT